MGALIALYSAGAANVLFWQQDDGSGRSAAVIRGFCRIGNSPYTGRSMQETIVSSTVSVLKFLISYVLWSLILFNVGRASLLISTMGRYPRGRALEQHINRISFAGTVVIFVLWAAIAIHNNSTHG